jgi:hypothetical protein
MCGAVVTEKFILINQKFTVVMEKFTVVIENYYNQPKIKHHSSKQFTVTLSLKNNEYYFLIIKIASDNTDTDQNKNYVYDTKKIYQSRWHTSLIETTKWEYPQKHDVATQTEQNNLQNIECDDPTISSLIISISQSTNQYH